MIRYAIICFCLDVIGEVRESAKQELQGIGFPVPPATIVDQMVRTKRGLPALKVHTFPPQHCSVANFCS